MSRIEKWPRRAIIVILLVLIKGSLGRTKEPSENALMAALP